MEGVLAHLARFDRGAPAGAPEHPGIFNYVETSGQFRKLPTAYLGGGPIFTSRDRAEVVAQLEDVVSMAMSGYARAVYSGTACTFHGRTGIYARDQHNRSAFRRQLGRTGFEFSDDPFVLLDESGTMSVRDWGAFSPEFAIGGTFEADKPDVVTTEGGLLTFLLMAQRVGPRRGTPELVALRSALGGIRGFNSGSAESLTAAIGRELGA